MHPTLSQFFFYRPAHMLRGETVIKCIREIEQYYAERLNIRRDIQWDKLMSLLQYVYHNNAYYKSLFNQHGIRPSNINNPDDLRKIPFLTKTNLQTAGDKILSNGVHKYHLRSTSGSTGTPLILKKDSVASSYMAALMYYVYEWYGIQPGDKQARVWGVPLGLRDRMLTNLKDWTLNRRRLSAFDISPQSCANYYKTLLRFKPKFMYGLPSTISALTSTLQEIEVDPTHLGLDVIITTGEVLFDSDREKISKAFGCRVVNEYGTTETGIIAFESSDNKMIQMTHNHFIEVINPETGEPVPYGQSGQLCVTELHSYGTPLIRYVVGDIAMQGSDTDADSDPELEQIIGRVSDLIVCPDGRKVAAAVLDYSFGPAVQRFKAFQRSLTRLEIEIEKSDTFSMQALAEAERSLRDKLGNSIEIDFRIVDSISASPSGKMTVLESDLPASEGEQRPGASWSKYKSERSN